VQRLDQPAPRVAGPRDLLRRITRWFNLTLVQQATWPVVVLLSGTVMQRPAQSSFGDVLGMMVGPLGAALLAVHFARSHGDNLPSPPVPGIAPEQVRLLILGLPFMLLIGRAITGSASEAIKVTAVGIASVAAFHAIHFGVVPGLFKPRLVVPLLFGLSWAIHQIADALARDTGGSFLLHALSGFTLGLLVAGGSLVLHRWPGGIWTAPALHLTIIYLIFGFAA
jgi:hypothetical protein